MKTSFNIVIFAVFLLGLQVQAKAQDTSISGNDIYQMCGQKHRSEACTMFVIGLVSGVTAQAALTDTQPKFCAPSTVNFQQYADVFYNFLNEHPEKRHMPVAAIAIYSWSVAFSCGTKK